MIIGKYKFYNSNEQSLILATYLLTLNANCFEVLWALVKESKIIWDFYFVDNIDDILSNVRSE